jgi:hypothetical protein
MCLLGSGFDTDPLLPWAAEILNDKTTSDHVARGDRLYSRAWEYIAGVIPDYRDATGQPITPRFVGELKQLRNESDDTLTADYIPTYSRELIARLERVFPAKCRYVGNDRVSALIPAGIEAAARYGITGQRGITLFIALMFVLGRGFDRDPLLPWASEILNDATITEQNKRVTKLYGEGLDCLSRWWRAGHGPEA